MKDLSRLAATADFRNHPQNYLVLEVRDASSPDAFGLVPKADNTAIYLPSSDGPSYRVAIAGENPDVLDRLGKALSALARRQRELAAEAGA
jgi:hypothetical protein